MISKKKILTIATAITLTSASLFGATNNTKVYATVNGENVTQTDVALALKNPRIQFNTLPKAQQKQVLNQIIDSKLLGAAALQTDVVNTPLYKDTLEKTIKTLKQDLAVRMWMQNIAKNIVVKDADIKKYYDEHKDKFKQPAELKASHILVKTKKEAQDIIATLNKSKNLKADFTKMAKTKSTGPSGANGGELGWFAPNKMVKPFSDAAMKLDVGTITKQPVQTQFGYHVIYLDDKKSSSFVPFQTAKNQIKQYLGQKLFQEKIGEIIKQKRAKANIVYK